MSQMLQALRQIQSRPDRNAPELSPLTAEELAAFGLKRISTPPPQNPPGQSSLGEDHATRVVDTLTSAALETAAIADDLTSQGAGRPEAAEDWFTDAAVPTDDEPLGASHLAADCKDHDLQDTEPLGIQATALSENSREDTDQPLAEEDLQVGDNWQPEWQTPTEEMLAENQSSLWEESSQSLAEEMPQIDDDGRPISQPLAGRAGIPWEGAQNRQESTGQEIPATSERSGWVNHGPPAVSEDSQSHDTTPSGAETSAESPCFPRSEVFLCKTDEEVRSVYTTDRPAEMRPCQDPPALGTSGIGRAARPPDPMLDAAGTTDPGEAAVSVQSGRPEEDGISIDGVPDAARGTRNDGSGSSAAPPERCEPEHSPAFGDLSDKIVAQLPPEGPAVVMFTGPCKMAEQAEPLAALTKALASKAGGPVVLVDASDGASQVDGSATHGPSQGLSRRSEVVASGYPGLDLMAVGSDSSAGPSSAAGEPLANLVRQLRSDYGLVLLSVESTSREQIRSLAPICDGAYLVVRLGHTFRRAAEKTIRALDDCGARLRGCIVIQELLDESEMRSTDDLIEDVD